MRFNNKTCAEDSTPVRIAILVIAIGQIRVTNQSASYIFTMWNPLPLSHYAATVTSRLEVHLNDAPCGGPDNYSVCSYVNCVDCR